ncbi:DNA-binding response OmpR family regulator [Variovorax sp. 54]|uniref:winged helix-turn-helix domain-containing protein n=1 Tax=Variovorax sp. 54 TaxID=2035212 RepID=UPI000C17AA54|nr:winged helix-turn-helix domain-containing protein [Variovorax sp. 54]PIF78381.1 DNA-binding response OmpR family regulator [Variovorax sp. 54]
MPLTTRVALLDEQGVTGGQLLHNLPLLGYDAFQFSSLADFFASLDSGRQVDLLLVVVDNELASRSLFAACRALNIQTLLIVRDKRWEQLLPWRDAPGWDDFIELHGAGIEDTMNELAWRMRTLLLRARHAAQSASLGPPTWGPYRFLDMAHTVLLHDQRIRLQPRQYAFAVTLFRNAGQVITRDWLWQSIWDKTTPYEGTRVLDVCAANIRKRLDLCAENGYELRAVYKQGYRLVPVWPVSKPVKEREFTRRGRPRHAALAVNF